MSQALSVIQTIHGEVRWLIAIAGAIAIVVFALGWLRRSQYKSLHKNIMTAYNVVMDINVTLGLIIIIALGILQGIWPMARIEHGFTMIVAAVVAHLSARWRGSPDDSLKFRNNLIVVVVSLLLVVVGVLRLRGTWMTV